MIELTQEQWQAITREENPTIVEPTSLTPYVMIRKDQYDRLRNATAADADAAYLLRVVWMRRMGLDDEEIAESIRDEPPVDMQEEMRQLRALERLDNITPGAEVLRRYATKY
jgi:hypothetical protein